ncbi:MAG: nucleoside/nucleotide kinase family protein [Erysipelotrichaceae bacterium]|nr:nucleoside/nucleotide kinase family protein [Erysipelotrichaceae bacterium]
MLINGLPVTAEYTEHDIETIFKPLLHKLTRLQKVKGNRIVVFFAAPPGLGKTTLARFLEDLSQSMEGVTPIQAAGMDGFHHYGSYLKTHTTIRDGQEILLNSIKGAPETFDAERLGDFIDRLKKEERILWPDYNRTLHDVVDDGYELSGDIIFLEGNYLLLSDERWKPLAQKADFAVYASADLEILKPRLAARKIMSGYSEEEAVQFVEKSDGRNAQLVLNDRPKADLYLEYTDGKWTASVSDIGDISDLRTAEL